jgi:hypothetical protein
MKAYWGSGGIAPGILASELDGGEWSASRPCRFTPRKRAPGTRWIGGWVGTRAGLEEVVKRNIPSPWRESNRDRPPCNVVAIPTELFRLRHFYSTDFWGWACPRVVLDAVMKRKILSPCRDLNPSPPIMQPVAQRYISELSRLSYLKLCQNENSNAVFVCYKIFCNRNMTNVSWNVKCYSLNDTTNLNVSI